MWSLIVIMKLMMVMVMVMVITMVMMVSFLTTVLFRVQVHDLQDILGVDRDRMEVVLLFVEILKLTMIITLLSF